MGFFGKSSEEKAAESANNARIDRIILTTLDLRCNYDIIDIVISEEINADEVKVYEKGKRSLKERAAAIGADAVIGVQCFLCNTGAHGIRRWYGTAVKFR